MNSQSKDLVDRLGCLSKVLRQNPNIISKHIKSLPQQLPKQKITKKSKQTSKKSKRKKNLKNNNEDIIESDDDAYVNENTSPVKTTQEIQMEEEEDIDNENAQIPKKNRHKLYLFGDSDDEEIYQYDESDDNLPSVDHMEEEEAIENTPTELTHIQNISQANHKSDLKTYMKMAYFKKWRRNYQSKQIQASIEHKMQPFDEDPDPEIKKQSIYSTYLGQKKYKKFDKNEQMSVLDRLSKPRVQRSSRPIMDNQNKNQGVFIGNSQYKPKSEEERQRAINRRKIREITMERDGEKMKKKGSGMQITQKGVRITEQQLMKTLERLSEPTPEAEEPPKVKPDVSQEEQLAQSIRLSTPKKEIEMPKKKTNKQFLPTKYEQMETCERLSKPKPKSTPIKMKKENKYTLAEQTEICERLAQPKQVFVKDSNDEKTNNTHNQKRSKKSKRKKNRDQDNEPNLVLGNNEEQDPGNQYTKPSPSLSTRASPKRRVRFKSSNKNNGEKPLSQQLNDVLNASYGINDDNTPIRNNQYEYQRQSNNHSNSNTISSLQLESDVGFTTGGNDEHFLDASEIERQTIKEIDELAPVDSNPHNDFAEEEAWNYEDLSTNDDNLKSISTEEKSEPVSNDTDSAVDYILDEHGMEP